MADRPATYGRPSNPMRPPWTQQPRVMRVRQRSTAINLSFDALEGYQRHRSGRNAALIAHYGFLSVFPLMLVFTTVLGFVLQDRPDLQADIIDSALSKLPFIGGQISTDPAGLRGNSGLLVFGVLTALWGGMKAFIAVQWALDDVHEIDLSVRSSYVKTRARALAGIVVVGGAQVATAFLTSLVGLANFQFIGQLGLLAGAFVINVAVLGLTFRWLCSVTDPWRWVLPGSIAGGVVFVILQLLGTTIVSRSIANASLVYGTFASVIGLLTWMALHAMVALAASELNRVLAGHRMPIIEPVEATPSPVQPSPG
jgi:uncharacterized BrkB/YihY/UPF0761 family membrane protein